MRMHFFAIWDKGATPLMRVTSAICVFQKAIEVGESPLLQ